MQKLMKLLFLQQTHIDREKGYSQHMVWHYWGLTNMPQHLFFIVLQFGLDAINLAYE